MKIPKKKLLPEFLRKYFWDVDFSGLDAEKYPYFVIERILEHGDKKSVKWITNNYKISQIKEALIKRKSISPKSAVYWSLVFNVPKDKILCLKKSCQKTKRSHWPY